MTSRFKKGDRVDFSTGEGRSNGTPGTVQKRITRTTYEYVVIWDDGTTDNETYQDEELIPLEQESRP